MNLLPPWYISRVLKSCLLEYYLLLYRVLVSHKPLKVTPTGFPGFHLILKQHASTNVAPALFKHKAVFDLNPLNRRGCLDAHHLPPCFCHCTVAYNCHSFLPLSLSPLCVLRCVWYFKKGSVWGVSMKGYRFTLSCYQLCSHCYKYLQLEEPLQ